MEIGKMGMDVRHRVQLKGGGSVIAQDAYTK